MATEAKLHHDAVITDEHKAITPTSSEHDVENQRRHDIQGDKWTFRRFMAFIAMAFLWTGSQMPAYLYGGVPPLIYGDIGGLDRWTWLVLAYLFALGAICPFVGSLSDLFGRKSMAIFGAILLIIGSIVTATSHSMNIFIAGMAISGGGAGILELTALAVTSEIAPVKKRGLYVAVLIFTILPFCPSVLWAQYIAHYGTWRYIGLVCGVWAFLGLVLVVFFYDPPPRAATVGLTRGDIIKRIDFVGGFLSIAGLLLFTMAVQWGGYQYSWGSAHVIAPLVLGIVLFILFCFYELKFAKFPMFPRAIAKEPRILLLTLAITFVSGMNFFSLLLFWPTQSYNVYGHDFRGVGIRNLALGFPILAGACIILVLLSVTKGKIRELMLISCIFMTAGSGGMAALTRDNIWVSYVCLIVAGLGIGGIVVPASIITAIVCPDELIATVTALTLAIRVLGGAIGYSIYYNVFAQKFKENAVKLIGPACFRAGIVNATIIREIIELTSAGLVDEIKALPQIRTEAGYNGIILAGQLAYAKAYPWVYYISLAFGGATIIACFFLGNITKYMDDHVAVDLNDPNQQHHHLGHHGHGHGHHDQKVVGADGVEHHEHHESPVLEKVAPVHQTETSRVV